MLILKMSAAYDFGLSVVILIFITGCYTIPLPGVKSHAFSQNSYSSSLPNQESVFQNEFDFTPTFRNIMPYSSGEESLQQDTMDTNSDKPTSTENPLEKLLDKLYGSSDWRSLLGQDGKEKKISTTSLPLPTETTSNLSFQGFYSKEISGNRFNGLSRNIATTTKAPVVMIQYPHHSGNSKFMMKITGTRQHVSPDTNNLDSKKPDVKVTEMGAFSKDPGASSMFFKGQEVNNQQYITMQPLMSITQKPQLNTGGSSGFNPNYANVDGGHQPQYAVNSGMNNNFNPTEINDKQNMFQPNSAFHSFITQTGSDPNNRELQVDYDADAINERYTENINSLYQGQTGQGTETVYGAQQFGYRFSAYGNTKPQTYNADALNREMMESNRNIAQKPMGPMLMPGQKDQQTTLSSNEHLPKIRNDKELIAIHKNENAPYVLSSAQLPPKTTTKAPLSFGFVPGNLFPGQSYTSSGHQQNSGDQRALPPQFLRHIPVVTGNDAFDPDKINAAQNAYNPNAVSWIQSRDKEILVKREAEDVSDDITSTTMQTFTITSTVKDKSTNTSSSSQKISITDNNGVFDPNFVNSNQGQTDFIPGQMSPVFTAYNQNTFGQLQQSNTLQPGSMTGKGGATVNFDIAKLLGIKAMTTDNNTNASNSHGISPSFNANNANKNADLNNKNSSKHMNGFEMGFMGSGFDPNSANQGFSNILGSGGYGFSQGNTSVNSTMPNSNGYGGFDPNAANLGFGSAGFGMGNGDTSGSGGYRSSFDPNKVNQIAIKNPFQQKANGTNNGRLTSYFLGIVSGGNVQSSQYNSAYTSAFNPDSVNVAPYDPNKYNQVHLHFDPVDMLSKNPGIDNSTLVAAASAFDPDKINYPSMQQALSPAAMMSSNYGIGINALSSISAQYSKGSTNTNTSTSLIGNIKPTRKSPANTHQNQAGFDPVLLMYKLMQSASAFQPGNIGIGNQNHNPPVMIGSNSSAHAQSITLSPSTQSVNPTFSGSTQPSITTRSTTTGSASLFTSSTLPTTSIAASSNNSTNGYIG